MKLSIIIIIFLSAAILFGCSLSTNSSSGSPSNIAGYQVDNSRCVFVNPEQTNEVESTILTLEEAKSQVVRFILENGLARADGPVKDFPEYIYMKNAGWGPVVFVENIGTNYMRKYFYVFFGTMPDGALCASAAVDAKTGKVFTAGLIDYNSSNQTHFLARKEALKYVFSNFNESTNAVIRAVFYRNGDGHNYNPLVHWKYEIHGVEEKAFNLKKKGRWVHKLYIDPFISGNDPKPHPKNGMTTRWGNQTRVSTLEDDDTPIEGRWDSIHRHAHYEGAE